MILERIKELCDKNSVSVTQLENYLKFGNGTIRKWADVSPSVHKLQKVAEYFHVPVDYFLK